jgi:hypothetical protein
VSIWIDIQGRHLATCKQPLQLSYFACLCSLPQCSCFISIEFEVYAKRAVGKFAQYLESGTGEIADSLYLNRGIQDGNETAIDLQLGREANRERYPKVIQSESRISCVATGITSVAPIATIKQRCETDRS